MKWKKSFKKSTPEEVKKIRELYRKGLGLKKIGRIVGRNHSTVLYWLKKNLES